MSEIDKDINVPNKNDTISRRAAEDIVRFECGEWRGLAKTIIDEFEALPTVDAVQVVHGRWIDETFAPWGLVHHPYKCDQCGDHSEAPSNYCPNCGAIMDGKDGDDHES